jgi:acyl-CoA synthetase (AMP-forming)/AMP-acid ligase II
LFICGRLKDLIIVRGKNYHPQDLELAATNALKEIIRPGCIAAFSLSDGPGRFQDQVREG